MGCIYKILNNINKKIYIGLTTNTAEYRFKKHISMINSDGCSALYGAFKKYGIENFKVEEIAKSNSKEILMELESFYINKYNTMSPNGYNLTSGGENCIVSKETRQKISNRLKGREINWSKKVSIGLKKLWENQEYRDKQIEQKKQKRGKYRNGIVREKLRKDVDLISFKKDYESYMHLKEMSKKYNVSTHTIYKIIKRENITKRGYKCNKIEE